MKASFYQFRILENRDLLVHGIFGRLYGNFSLKYSSRTEVERNKKRVAKELDIDGKKIYSIRQVHGTQIIIINSARGENEEIEGDGLITNQANVFLMVKTADCFPVLMYDSREKIAAAVHVGWRGAVQKIFWSALLKMINQFHCQPENILAAIGPGIRACCFKHKNLIQSKFPEWRKYIKKDKQGWSSLSLDGFIIDKLIEAGLKKNNIENAGICTGCNKKYFSHWRSLKENESQGRFCSIIGIRKN